MRPPRRVMWKFSRPHILSMRHEIIDGTMKMAEYDIIFH